MAISAGLVRGHVIQAVHLLSSQNSDMAAASCLLDEKRRTISVFTNLPHHDRSLSSDTIMGGGEMPYKVPDWKIYQVGKHTPELEQVQRMLSSLGLKVSWS